MSLVDSIRVDPSIATVPEFQKRFKEVADIVLNGMVLDVKGNLFRFAEVEFYFMGGAHRDVFTHCQPDQGHHGNWYFHKHGSGFKGGTYKGVDMSIGTPGKSHGGILIRSIQNLKDDSIIEGPCRVVDSILNTDGNPKTVQALVEAGGNLCIEKFKCATVRAPKNDTELPRLNINVGPRVGLVLRKQEGEPYWMEDYRFTTAAAKLGKFRAGIALSLYRNGVSESEIDNIVKLQKGKLGEAIEIFKKGQKKDIHTWVDKKIPGPADVFEAYGAGHPPGGLKSQWANAAGVVQKEEKTEDAPEAEQEEKEENEEKEEPQVGEKRGQEEAAGKEAKPPKKKGKGTPKVPSPKPTPKRGKGRPKKQ